MECTCGISNLDTARFCKGCGGAVNDNSKLIQGKIKNCHSCSSPLKNGALFCNKCGSKCLHRESASENVEAPVITPVVNNLQCEFCNTELTQNAKFCLNCGKSCLTPEITQPIVQSSIKSESKTLLNDLPIESPRENLQTNSVENKTKDKSNITLISIVSVGAISIGLVSWLGFNEYQKTKIVAPSIGILSTQASPPIEPNIETRQVEEAANNSGLTVMPSKATEPTSTPPSELGQAPSSKYVGQNIKDGTILDSYSISLIGKSGAFKVFSAFDSDDSGTFMFTKFILVTDLNGKVITSKQSFDQDSILIDSKSACIINSQPYFDAFALSSTTKELSTPPAVWKVSETGKLITQNVTGIKCGVYLKFMDESDVVESVTGYNDLKKPKPLVQKQTKVNSSPMQAQSQLNKSISKPTAIESKNSLPVATNQQPESNQPQHQEVNKPEEQKSKPMDSLGGLLQKLGGSIPKGEENHVCTSSERAMNQCQ